MNPYNTINLNLYSENHIYDDFYFAFAKKKHYYVSLCYVAGPLVNKIIGSKCYSLFVKCCIEIILIHADCHLPTVAIDIKRDKAIFYSTVKKGRMWIRMNITHNLPKTCILSICMNVFLICAFFHSIPSSGYASSE